MVNHGPSKGCETCKKRRKKCDEGRPECKNCLKGGRACLGYPDEAAFVFRHYLPSAKETQHPDEAAHLSSPNIQSSASDGLSTTILPLESTSCNKDDDHIERRALLTFFNEFCVRSQHPTLSRGFLDGLQSLIVYSGNTSELAEAARLVSLATLGNKLKRPTLLKTAKSKYGCLLGRFQTSLSNPATSKTIQNLMVAVLLGIYEIVTGYEGCPGMHDAHLRGVAAILDDEHSPFQLSAGVRLFQLSNAMCLKECLKPADAPGVLCAPAHSKPVTDLDAIFIQFNSKYQQALNKLNDLDTTPGDLKVAQIDLLRMTQVLRSWPDGQPEEWQPGIAGVISEDHDCLICRLGPSTTYLDLYVAAVWNIYRKSHLLKLEMLVRCARLLGEDPTKIQQEAEYLAEQIVGSAPFHLISNLRGHRTKAELPSPNKTAGGLLLMHPLWVVRKCHNSVSKKLRAHAISLLAWIGEYMGIGQANLLSANADELPFRYVAQGHVLMWAGMLIHPA